MNKAMNLLKHQVTVTSRKGIRKASTVTMIAGLLLPSFIALPSITSASTATLDSLPALLEQARKGPVTLDYLSSAIESAQKLGSLLSGATDCKDNHRNLHLTLANASKLTLRVPAGGGSVFTSGKLGEAPATVVRPGDVTSFAVCSKSGALFTGVVGAVGWAAYLDPTEKLGELYPSFPGIDALRASNKITESQRKFWYTAYTDPNKHFFVGDFAIGFSNPAAGAVKVAHMSTSNYAYYANWGVPFDSKYDGNKNGIVDEIERTMEVAISRINDQTFKVEGTLLGYIKGSSKGAVHHWVSFRSTQQKNGYMDAFVIVLYPTDSSNLGGASKLEYLRDLLCAKPGAGCSK